MARYGGVIGFGITEQTRKGIWEPENIVERPYYGDVNKPKRQTSMSNSVNGDVKISAEFSIVADGFADEHFLDIRYLTWKGKKWTVIDAVPDTERPRLNITIGDIWKEEEPEEEEEEEDDDE